MNCHSPLSDRLIVAHCLLASTGETTLAASLADLMLKVSQVGYVKGIDLSPGEIREAQKRFDEFSSQPSRRSGV